MNPEVVALRSTDVKEDANMLKNVWPWNVSVLSGRSSRRGKEKALLQRPSDFVREAAFRNQGPCFV